LNVEDEELLNRITDLQEQLQCEEKNMKHSQMKLVAIELECQRCNRELQDYEDKLKEAIKAQDTTETYMSFIAQYLTCLKDGFIDSLHLSPVERGIWSSSPRAITLRIVHYEVNRSTTTTFVSVLVVIATILGICRLTSLNLYIVNLKAAMGTRMMSGGYHLVLWVPSMDKGVTKAVQE
jgi:hypothetical protein